MTASFDPTAVRISIGPQPKTLPLPGGRQLFFTDAVLSIRNDGDRSLLDLVPRLSIRQEEASLCEGSDALLAAVPSEGLEPGEAVEWGLYELLQVVDRGFASKTHLFGPKAALNWKFHLEVGLSGRAQGCAQTFESPAFRVTFHWYPVEGDPGRVELEVKG